MKRIWLVRGHAERHNLGALNVEILAGVRIATSEHEAVGAAFAKAETQLPGFAFSLKAEDVTDLVRGFLAEIDA